MISQGGVGLMLDYCKVKVGSQIYIQFSESEELDRFNFKSGYTEGIVNYALSIKGIKFAIFGREGTNQSKTH